MNETFIFKHKHLSLPKKYRPASSRDSVAPHSPKRVSPFSIVEAFYLGATKSPARLSKEPRARYRNRARPLLSRAALPPGRLELPTYGLENRCSIRLSYKGMFYNYKVKPFLRNIYNLNQNFLLKFQKS